MASNYSSEKKSHTSLTLFQKLEMTKLIEVGMLTVEKGQNKASCAKDLAKL